LQDGDKCTKCIEGKVEERIVWQGGEKTRIFRCDWCGYEMRENRSRKKNEVAYGQLTLDPR
jgi:hypothetical protein